MSTWPGPRRVTHKPPGPASLRGMAAALAELAAPPVGQGSADLLAERERLAREAEDSAARQGVLCLPLRRL